MDRRGGRALPPPWLVAVVLALAVIGSRGLAVTLPSELSPDEGQLLAQAMRFAVDPAPWRGVDGTTSGPLNTWMLVAANTVGMPLRHQAAHALAALMLALSLVVTYLTLHRVVRADALAAGVFGLSCIALAQGANSTYLASELLPTLVASAAIAAWVFGATRAKGHGPWRFVSAILIGLLPWTKLQSLPGALVLAIGLALTLGTGAAPATRGQRLRDAMVFLVIAAVPTLAMMLLVWVSGATADFWMSYVTANSAYASGAGFAQLPRKLITFLLAATSLPVIAAGVWAAAWCLSGRPGWREAVPLARQLTLVAGALTATHLIAILTPPHPFEHYSILLLQPTALLVGCLYGMWAAHDRAAGSARRAFAAFAALLAALIAVGAWPAWRSLRATARLHETVAEAAIPVLSQRIRELSPDGGKLAIWGWMPGLYVESGRTPATRFVIGQFLIEPTPAREHLRAAFLADLQRERPEVIVDAVAPGCFTWRWNANHRIASFPEFAGWVERHYALASELVLVPGEAPVRFYRRR